LFKLSLRLARISIIALAGLMLSVAVCAPALVEAAQQHKPAPKAAPKKPVAAKHTHKKPVASRQAPRKAVAQKQAPRKAVAQKQAPRKAVAQKQAPRKVVARKAVASKTNQRKVVAHGGKAKAVRPQGPRQLALQSRAALIVDARTGEILYGKNQTERVSIASITKLMTAMIVLDAGQDMNDILTITDADVDRLKFSSSRLNVGSKLTRHDMMLLALMSSENRAASALARNYPGGRAEAVKAMNRKAKALGMTNSQFADGTGLSPHNQASLTDLAKMVKAAAGYDTIQRLSTTEQHFAPVKGYKQRLKYQNSNPLVRNDSWDIGVTKTGYIKEAGHCLVMEARIGQRDTILVLMDSWGKYTRVGDAARVRSWVEGQRVAAK
jgi:D-alanyl-D-alanine endopeptidase (penicillin-binding protein 7)